MNTMKFLTFFFAVAGIGLAQCADNTQQKYKLTKHMIQRMVQRDISASDVKKVFQNGEKSPAGGKCIAATHKELKLIYNPASCCLITVYNKNLRSEFLPKKFAPRFKATEDITDIASLRQDRAHKRVCDRQFKRIEQKKNAHQKAKKSLLRNNFISL